MSKDATPAISVVMPVYNARAYVAEAIESVLQQTCGDFELVVIDDGSTDDTRSIVLRFRDPRVVVATNVQNLGVVASLAKGLAVCRGHFIARMDADDISEPERFAKQLDYLKSHPDVDIVGGAISYFGDIKRPTSVVFPAEHEDIRAALLFYCSLAHPALMFRHTLVERNLLQYSEEYRHAEDYHLWTGLLQHARAANLPDVLLRYRLHPTQVRLRHVDPQYEAAVRIRKLLLTRGGVDWTSAEAKLHEAIIRGEFGVGSRYINSVGVWFDKIERSNRISGFWEAQALHRLFAAKLAELAHRLGVGSGAGPLSDVVLRCLHDAGYRPEKSPVRLYRRARSLVRRALSG